MEKRLLAFVLFVCLTASAQLPVVPIMALTSANNADVFGGLAYRWVSSDLTTNTAITGNWTDRIQSASWTQGDASSRPTNSATGIWFDETHFLTNPGLSSFSMSNVAVGYIMNIVAPRVGSQTHPSLLNNTRTLVADNGSVRGYMFNANANAYNLVVQDNSSLSDNLSESPYSVTNAFSDLIISECVTNLGATRTWRRESYTNGVSDQATAALAGSAVWWGGSVASPNIPDSLAFNRPRSSSARFRLLELWVWTNAVVQVTNGQPISSISVSNFHWYRTNTYNF